jgi:hypothetical protein
VMRSGFGALAAACVSAALKNWISAYLARASF